MPEAVLITGCRILADGETLAKGDLLLAGGKIRKIARRIPAGGARVVSGKGLSAAPGLIDTQINGGFGYSYSGGSAERAFEVGRRLPEFGVTGYLPTLISLPREEMRRGIESLVAMAGRKGGARVLGIHLEGSFLSPQKRGAHREKNLRLPDVEEFRDCHRAAKGLLRKITLAPELPGALDVVREAAGKGVIASAGHTTASAAQFRAAVEAGVRHVTHVFNAMAPLHHRDSSILNAALLEDRVSCGFIYDRIHISADAASLLLRSKPPGKAVLVSDAVAALGAPDGDLAADGELYAVRDGGVTVKATGAIAGSAASILQGVRNLVEDLGLPLEDAVAFASAAPARLLGLGKRKGVLRPGADADVILLDSRLRVRNTFVGGELLYGDRDPA
jgi:N-acetylglucosamine-6-phosphate deacetylase